MLSILSPDAAALQGAILACLCGTTEAAAPINPLFPMTITLECLLIPKNNKTPPGPCEHHIQTPPICKKTNITMPIASHSTENNQLLFSTLVLVDRGSF